MLKKQRTLGISLVILQVIIAVSVISALAFLNLNNGDKDKNSAPEDPDPQLLYEVYVDGELFCTVDDIHDFFIASDAIESTMSEKLGYSYSISNDLDIELVAVRKNDKTVSSDEIHDLISNEVTAFYSECYAFYVGDDIIGYCPISEKEDLKQLAVDIIGYVSNYDPAHASTSNIYVALDYTYKSSIASNINDIHDALSQKSAFENKDDLDDTVADIIESIDQAILFGNTTETPESIDPELVVTSIRRVETEVIKYQKLRAPDTDYNERLGDDDPDEIYQKGKDGKCTVEYEDIYIGDELSQSIRVEESTVVLVEPVDEITIYGTQSTKASGTMVWPTVGWITSYYGKREAEFSGMSTNHKGLDISTSRKTKIVAADAGVVEFAGWHSGGFGYCVIIDHENGIKTLYAHMYAKPLVKEGDRVFQGEHLGGQGMTGSAGGIHLHLEVIKNGDRVNPINYMPTKRPNTTW